MQEELYDIRPLAERSPVHSSLTHAHVDALVDELAASVEKDERLRAALTRVTGGDWSDHVHRARQFWRSALLKTQEYTGRPVRLFADNAEAFEPDLVDRYLSLFHAACAATLPNSAHVAVVKQANSVADSLSLAMFGGSKTLAA